MFSSHEILEKNGQFWFVNHSAAHLPRLVAQIKEIVAVYFLRLAQLQGLVEADKLQGHRLRQLVQETYDASMPTPDMDQQLLMKEISLAEQEIRKAIAMITSQSQSPRPQSSPRLPASTPPLPGHLPSGGQLGEDVAQLSDLPSASSETLRFAMGKQLQKGFSRRL